VKGLLRVLAPILVLAGAVAGSVAIVRSRRPIETRIPEVPPPLVRVVEVHREDVRLTVRAQGTVAPRTESDLVPEVSGRVLSISPSLTAGGFFEEGETLVAIDPRDYELALVRARADVARAQLALAREEAEAEVARREWTDLGRGDPSPLVLREPQLAEARANLEAAKATLEQAERDLDRTSLRAPYRGRVRDERVDAGQFVVRGTPVASLYAVDVAEVRLPLEDRDLAFLDLSLHGASQGAAPTAILRARFAGRDHVWTGRVARSEGEIDPRSRLVYVVVEVADPYGRDENAGRPPLTSGLFVEAEILGRLARDVVVLPRAALRGREDLLVVDADDRLRWRRVEVLRAERDSAIVASGLAEGERVCLSPLDTPVEGMEVRTVAKEEGATESAERDG
jgi:RND family efflux transporter MFP subunit